VKVCRASWGNGEVNDDTLVNIERLNFRLCHLGILLVLKVGKVVAPSFLQAPGQNLILLQLQRRYPTLLTRSPFPQDHYVQNPCPYPLLASFADT
jgi:hypothetical protein